MKKVPLFTDGEDVSGKVFIHLKKGKKIEHQGIRMELVGSIEMNSDKHGPSDFVALGRELEPQGQITEDMSFAFNFSKVEKQFESYQGVGVRLRYLLRVTINKSYGKIVKE